jgi:hypothetical protein
MKIYCVFKYDTYYPNGPLDIEKVFSTREAAEAYEAKLQADPKFNEDVHWTEVSEHEVED